MYELNVEQFTKVLPLLDGIGNRAVYSLSVIEQIQHGRIFVDDAQQPTSVFVTNSGGFYCLAGQAHNEQFNHAVIAFMNEKANHNGFYALGIFSDGWELALNNYHLLSAKRIKRSYYKFNKEKFLEEFSTSTMEYGNGIEYSKLNVQIAHAYREMFYPYYKLVWESDSHFCKHGVGHFFLANSKMISVCTSPYMSNNYAEIDVITIDGYRRTGLATKLAVEFIKDCVERQLTPNWSCHSDNLESNKLAIKLGFEKLDEHPMYWYHD
jgi:hypothetical protein